MSSHSLSTLLTFTTLPKKRALRTFKRVNQHSELGGVCGGLAYWLGLPAWVLRMALFCAVAFYGVGLGAYLLLAFFAPAWQEDPTDYEEVVGE